MSRFDRVKKEITEAQKTATLLMNGRRLPSGSTTAADVELEDKQGEDKVDAPPPNPPPQRETAGEQPAEDPAEEPPTGKRMTPGNKFFVRVDEKTGEQVSAVTIAGAGFMFFVDKNAEDRRCVLRGG